jgi:fermentation-respiration switch protein FrsA (DUF1100 family)
MARRMLWLTVLFLVALGALKAFVLAIEASFAFYPERGVQDTPEDAGIAYQDLSIATADGETLHGWLIPSDRPRAEVIFWHGNGGNLSVWLPAYLDFPGRRLSVLAFDYRGYGRSSGTPSERGLYRDTDAVLDDFWRRRTADVPVIYWGRSIGTAFAAYATTVRSPDALVLETPFADADALLSNMPLVRVLAKLSSYRFPTAEFLRGFDRPVLIIHGDRDEIVPLAAGRSLFDGLDAPKTFAEIPGAHHNDLRFANPAPYDRAIDRFLDAVAPETD